MSPGQREAILTARRFPRVSGDEPQVAPAHLRDLAFSPRERRVSCLRFPRVSGDEPQVKNIIGAAKVFSPRERG